ISNAMDVGSPSNFVRMKLLSGEDWDRVRSLVTGDFYDDTQTRQAIKSVYDATSYVMCPHTAVAYLALKNYLRTVDEPVTGVFLSTAHPAKFLNVVQQAIGTTLPLPDRLAVLLDKEKAAHPMTSRFDDFKAYLLAEA
ncbi:MAG: threonine synthase, partial [Cytophagaceae bacterium]|nr:threonine synthase [Cytophagaceae bacterium]